MGKIPKGNIFCLCLNLISAYQLCSYKTVLFDVALFEVLFSNFPLFFFEVSKWFRKHLVSSVTFKLWLCINNPKCYIFEWKYCNVIVQVDISPSWRFRCCFCSSRINISLTSQAARNLCISIQLYIIISIPSRNPKLRCMFAWMNLSKLSSKRVLMKFKSEF